MTAGRGRSVIVMLALLGPGTSRLAAAQEARPAPPASRPVPSETRQPSDADAARLGAVRVTGAGLAGIARQIQTMAPDAGSEGRLGPGVARSHGWWRPAVAALEYILFGIVGVLCSYMARHYAFTLNRLFGRQRHPYADILLADWPTVTVVIPMHNEAAVAGGILDALLDADYPAGKLRILPVNDRSEDGTGDIIDAYAARHPDRIFPLHRRDGTPGKAAALKDASATVTSEIQLVFDADYTPGPGLIKQLVSPFLDPEVGAVMGRVVPFNSSTNLLTRLLELERAGGYQVDQQARMNMALVPQFGGTVGGVRQRALEDVGGWRDDTLAEDTDVTYRLLLHGWLTIYQNRAECYEEVPETWPVRIRQIMRWARGHNQSLARYLGRVLGGQVPGGFWLRVDAVMLLGIYMVAPLIAAGWLIALALFYLGEAAMAGLIAALAVASYSTVGNAAAFFEVAAATKLDGSRARCRLLPFLASAYLVSLVSVTRSLFPDDLFRRGPRRLVWDKTRRYRHPST
jgi:cellulose synthase/poly-beta-1,6-N-acetylglucosamine synthase-like glycosyltransferase